MLDKIFLNWDRSWDFKVDSYIQLLVLSYLDFDQLINIKSTGQNYYKDGDITIL